MIEQVLTGSSVRSRSAAFGTLLLLVSAALVICGWNASGALADSPPLNDAFAHATAVYGSSGSVGGDTSLATLEPFEPIHYSQSNGSGSLWYQWQAGSNGYVSFNTDGAFDSNMAAYKRADSGFSGLRKMCQNDDDPLMIVGVGSRVSFYATAGTTYYIAVGGMFPSSYGPLQMTWSFPAAAPESTAPVAEASGPYAVAAGDSLVLDGTASCRIDGSSPTDLTYQWDLYNAQYDTAEGVAPVIPWDTVLSESGFSEFTNPRTGLPEYTVHLQVTGSGSDPTSWDTALLRIYEYLPTATFSNIDAEWHNAPFLVTLSAFDAASTEYSLNGGPFQAYTEPFLITDEGITSVTYFSTDLQGPGTSTTEFVKIDLGPPVSDDDVEPGWHRILPSVDITATDVWSGLAGSRYAINGSESATFTTTLADWPEGINQLSYASVDMAGNWEATHTVDVAIDTTPPQTTSNAETYYPELPTILLVPTDTGSGVISTKWQLDSSGFWTEGLIVPIETTGAHTLEWYSTDAAGNTENTQSTAFVVQIADTTPPVSQASPDGVWRSTPETVAITATDDGPYPPEIHYALDGGPEQIYTVPFSVSAEGTTTIEYWAIDAAVNEELPHNSTLVRIDRTAPEVTTSAATGWTSSGQLVTLAATDAGVGADSLLYSTGGSEPLTPYPAGGISVTAPGVTTIRYRSTDLLGNTALGSVDVRIDPSAPLSQSDVPVGWILPTRPVTLSATDTLSGVARIDYALDGGPANEYLSPFTVPSDGSHDLQFRATDKAGNKESTRTATVNVDGSAPVTSDDAPSGWSTATVAVHLVGSDSLSGTAKTFYTLGETTPTIEATSATMVSAEGTSTLRFYSIDNVGNTEAVRSKQVRIDRVAPSTTASAPTGWSATAVTVRLYPSDSTSGVRGTRYSVNGSAAATYTAPITVSAEGSNTVAFQSVDVAGNWESTQTVAAKVDYTKPVTTSNAPTGIQWQNTTVTLSATDALSGVARSYYKLGGGSVTTYTAPVLVSAEGTTVVSFWSVDAVGNVETTKTANVRIDKTTPRIQGTLTNRGAPLSGVLVSSYNSATHALTQSASTDASGSYSMFVPVGAYHVRFTNTTPASLSQYFDHKATVSEATTVTASGGGVVVSSDLGPTIQGTVTNRGVPLSGVIVSSFDATTHAYIKGVMTSAAGTYSMPMPPGSYHLRFTGTNPASLSQYYDHRVNMSDSATVTALGGICQVSADLGPTIQGTLTNQGSPLSGVVVSFFDATTHAYLKGVLTNAEGFYLTTMPLGSYHMRFTGTTPPSLSQYYDHQVNASDSATVTTLGGICQVSSDLGPTMQGTITNEGTPLSGVVVSAFDATTHVYLKGVMTSATGYYSMSVPTGSYHLRFTGTTPASLSQYHGHTVTASGATTISAPGGICLVSSDLGPVVQGTITNQGAPLSGVVVSAFNATTHVYVKGVLTNAAGYYSMSLPTGTYHLRFTGTTPASLSQYYDHAISPDTAAIVTATGLAVTVSSDLAPIPR